VPAVDEALIVLAELALLAGLAALANQLWLSRPEPYPALVARAINATAPGAETVIVLPQPVNITTAYVSFGGERAAIPRLSAVSGDAVRYLLVYNASVRVVRGG